ADSPPCDWIPAVHAGMTGFNHLCITTRSGAWGSQTVCLPTLELALPLPACDRQSKQALTLQPSVDAQHQ
ncbi:MAG: hypothetical protein ACOYMG_07745, partial [Candidatus Methylumidiphilus sp.]